MQMEETKHHEVQKRTCAKSDFEEKMVKWPVDLNETMQAPNPVILNSWTPVLTCCAISNRTSSFLMPIHNLETSKHIQSTNSISQEDI